MALPGIDPSFAVDSEDSSSDSAELRKERLTSSLAAAGEVACSVVCRTESVCSCMYRCSIYVCIYVNTLGACVLINWSSWV